MYLPLMPHAVCWRQDQRLIWTMAITNAITFVSYFSICASLFYVAGKTRRAIMRDWIFLVVGFALFIAACGSTHLLEVITTWISAFWVAAWANIVTAVLSAYVAIQFMRRASKLGVGINEYARRLKHAQSEKAQIEESLLAARKLEEWNRMSAIATHEINNPLTAIQNLMYLIQNSSSAAPEVRMMAEQAADEVRRIGTIARSNLGFFRRDPQPALTDIRASADSVAFLLEPLLRQRGLDLAIESSGDCTVNAFSMEARQVLLNLIRNACEASTRRGAQVRVSIAGRIEDVLLVVEDEGVGIAPEMLARLFQFGVSTKGENGNGIGLWAVKKLIERHGGTINVESVLDKGTRFTLCWPREFPVEEKSGNSLVELAVAP